MFAIGQRRRQGTLNDADEIPSHQVKAPHGKPAWPRYESTKYGHKHYYEEYVCVPSVEERPIRDTPLLQIFLVYRTRFAHRHVAGVVHSSALGMLSKCQNRESVGGERGPNEIQETD